MSLTDFISTIFTEKIFYLKLAYEISKKPTVLRHRETSMQRVVLSRAYHCYLFTWIAEKMEQKKEFAKSKRSWLGLSQDLKHKIFVVLQN